MSIEELMQEYIQEALYMKKYINKIKKEINHKLLAKDPVSCYRMSVLCSMYENLKSISLYLATKREDYLK